MKFRLASTLVLVLIACGTTSVDPPSAEVLANVRPEGRWIAPPAELFTAAPFTNPLLRKSFDLSATVKSARVVVVGLGDFVLRVNGVEASDGVFHQTWSQYDARILATAFDVGPLLKPGRNTLAVMLGNAWWKVGPVNDPGRYSKTDAMPDFSSGQPYLLNLDLEGTTTEGSMFRVVSDASWTAALGPVTFSHVYAGEDYDARGWPEGWDRGADLVWTPVSVVAAPKATVGGSPAPPMRVKRIDRPIRITEPAPGVFVWTFPENLSGMLRFTVDGRRGSTIRFKPCEYLTPEGRVKFTYTWGTGKDIWCDYTLRGGGPESHMNRFFYTGFRYVEVTGAVPEGHPNPSGLPVIRTLELAHVRADAPEVGVWRSTDDLQNAAHSLIDASIRSNMAHVMTDCPHREKAGWQEQNWHMARSISYRYDMRGLFGKICMDLRDGQLPDGHVPTNVPNWLVGVPPHGYWNEAPEWGVTAVLLPWHLHTWYGDEKTLAASFDSMKAYVDYLGTQAKDGLLKSNLGDWYDYGHGKGDGPSRFTPSEVSATAVWAWAAATVADAAVVLRRPEDAMRYRGLFETVRKRFIDAFWDPTTGMVRNGGSCQAGNAVALCVGLLPEEDREKAVAAIVADLEKRGYQQTTGEVLHVFLVRALAKHRRHDVLHRIYARTERGSYGYMVKSGLTSLPESWDAQPGGGNSMNHCMLGHLVEWHFAHVAGLHQADGDVGWKRVVVEPNPGDLDAAEASFVSPSGPIRVAWQSDRGPNTTSFRLSVELPDGVEAEVRLPDGTVFRQTGGSDTYGSMSRRVTRG